MIQSNDGQNAQDVQTFISAAELLDAQAVLTARINNVALPSISINPNVIYCNKSGQPIGQRDANALMQAIAIFGKSDFVNHAYYAHGLNVAAAWIKTDDESLDKLLEHDPVGYATYALGLITAKYTNKPARPSLDDIAVHHYALARTYACLRACTQLQSYSFTLRDKPINQLNMALCEFLAFAPDTTGYITRQLQDMARSPDRLAKLAIDGILLPLLEKITRKAYERVEYGAMLVRFHVGNVPTSETGPTQIKRQTRGRSRSKAMQINAQFADLGFGRIIDTKERALLDSYDEKRQHKPAWQQFVAREEVADKPLPKGFEQLADMNLEDWVMPNKAADDEVEMHIMTAAETAAHNREKFPTPLPEVIKPHVPAPSILARIQTQKAAQPVSQPQPKLTGILAMLAKGNKQ